MNNIQIIVENKKFPDDCIFIFEKMNLKKNFRVQNYFVEKK